jgi:hypothetical protein
MFLEGGQTRKHCFLYPCLLKVCMQIRKHYFLAMFSDGGQTRQLSLLLSMIFLCFMNRSWYGKYGKLDG